MNNHEYDQWLADRAPIDEMFRVVCMNDDKHWVLASRSKVFPTLAMAQKYLTSLDRSRFPELFTVKQLRAAYEIGGKCQCGNCMCCDLRYDIRTHDINLRPRPEQVVRPTMEN